jgi:xanthine dehydrogenase small subunit
MAGIVKRAALAEAAVRGQPWTEATARAAMAALERDFTPLTDMRGSAGYRLRSARNLLLRLWLETRTDDPLPADATQVWAAMPHDALA